MLVFRRGEKEKEKKIRFVRNKSYRKNGGKEETKTSRFSASYPPTNASKAGWHKFTSRNGMYESK